VVAFYLDNDVSREVGTYLREHHHYVTHTRDQQQTRAHDEVQLLTALDLQALLVTHNYKDFAMLHRAWELWRVRWNIEEFHPCILVLPHGPSERLVDALLAMLQAGLPAQSTLYRLRASGVWIAE
jgi:hypothetical protein